MNQAYHGGLPCLFCKERFMQADTIIAHCARAHDPQLNTAQQVYGIVCPACGETFDGRLPQHASRTHGKQIALLFEEAEAAGDPHGVIVDRLDFLQALFEGQLEKRMLALGAQRLQFPRPEWKAEG